jgi:hypothetical protein
VKKFTIMLDEEVAIWAKVEALRRSTSVSNLVAEVLRQHMEDGEIYGAAMKRHLSRKPTRLKRRGTPYPRRDALHQRRGLC